MQLSRPLRSLPVIRRLREVALRAKVGRVGVARRVCGDVKDAVATGDASCGQDGHELRESSGINDVLRRLRRGKLTSSQSSGYAERKSFVDGQS